MADWTERYRPSSLSAIRGNDKARDALREWADSWPDAGRAVILHGSPGVGKTSAAHALAADFGWQPIELNASDDRTADVLDRIAGEAAATWTLDGSRKLIILDEADNLHHHADYGGTSTMTEIAKRTAQPLVLIGNDYYEMSRGLRNACEEIEFRDLSTRSVIPVLRDICRKEGIEFDDEALQHIAEESSGDLRSAIKDLQAIGEGRDAITVDDVVTGSRDRTTGIFPFLDTVFKKAGPKDALFTAYEVDETPDQLLAWVEDNVSKDYHGHELANAYGRLAAADRWLGRVIATQNYSYWRYATDNIAAGVAAAREEEKGGWTRYGPPSFWRRLGQSRGSRDRRDTIARKIASNSSVSMATARQEMLPFLSAMTHHCHNRELTVTMAAQYDLDADDIAFITGSGASTNKVGGIVEEATRRRDEQATAAAPLAPGTDEAGASFDIADDLDDEPAADEEDEDGQAGLSDFL